MRKLKLPRNIFPKFSGSSSVCTAVTSYVFSWFVTKIGLNKQTLTKCVKIKVVYKGDFKIGLDHDKGLETRVVSLFFDTDNLF